MKKILKIIIYIIAFFIIYFLELFLFNNLKIAGIKPNIFLMAIIIIGIYTKPEKAFATGVIFGLLIDVLNAKTIGITAICLGLLGYGIASIEKTFSIESKLSLIIFIAGGTVAYELVSYIIQVIVYTLEISILKIIQIITIETIYHILLTIIFYPLFKKILKIAAEEVQESRIDGYLKRMR